MLQDIEAFAHEHPIATVGIGLGTVAIVFYLFSSGGSATTTVAAPSDSTAAAASLAADQYNADAATTQASIAAGVQAASISAQQAVSIAGINASTDQLANTNATNLSALQSTNSTNLSALQSTNATNLAALQSNNSTAAAINANTNATNLSALQSNNSTALAINANALATTISNNNAAVNIQGDNTLASEFANLAAVLNNYSGNATSAYVTGEAGAQAVIGGYVGDSTALAGQTIAGQVSSNHDLFGAQASADNGISSAASSEAASAANAQASEINAVEGTAQVGLRQYYNALVANTALGIPGVPTQGTPAEFTNQANNTIAQFFSSSAPSGTAASSPGSGGYQTIGSGAQNVGATVPFTPNDIAYALNATSGGIASDVGLTAIPGAIANLQSALGQGIRFDAAYGG